ncbi:MAG TPA: condensation domain-containing protein, partial [Opitutaceae bacterium]
MMFHALKGVSDVDVQQVVCELPEALDPAAFAQAWREMVVRHDALRLSFSWNGAGEPRQSVQPAEETAGALEVAVKDISAHENARAEIETYLAADRRRGFSSLEAAPLLRVALFTGRASGAPRSWWIATYHHILLDARSMVPLFSDVMACYEALASGEPTSFSRPAPRFSAFAQWLQSVDHARAETFWREHLRGFSTPTTLPIARMSLDAANDHGSADLVEKLSESATTQLRRAAERHAVTLNTLVQAAWALVLSRYSGEDEVVFGALRACRHVPVEGAADMVGLLINTVPVRSRATDATPVTEWLQGLRRQWVAFRDHEHTPLSRVQAWSDVPVGHALFDTLLNFQETSWEAALQGLGGKWAQRRLEIRSRTGYPLAIDVYGGSALMLRAFYERNRFEAAAIARLLGHFRTALEALAADACQTVGDLSLLSAGERQRILVDWNRTDAAYPRATCVHHEFERRVELAPDRIAVTDTATALTYREL